MKESEVKSVSQTTSPAVILIFCAIGWICRIIAYGRIPGGLSSDEAFAGYEAWSILTTGSDSWGYPHPVYLETWGSGMSALQSYLMLPSMSLFGANPWTLRFPQVLLGCISVPIFYLFMKRITDESCAFWGLLLFSLCPWHIMMSRWGLDCNIAPGLILLAMYFFVLGVQKNPWFFVLSALFYGLSLYAYAVVWLVVPLYIVLQLGYLLLIRKKPPIKPLLASTAILALLAAPLMWFLLVNLEILPEFVSPVLSIPRLIGFKADDVSVYDIPARFKTLIHMLLFQNDDQITNTIPEFGFYYRGALVFAFIGLIYALRDTFRSLKTRTFDGQAIILLHLIPSLLLGLTIYVNSNRANCIHIPILALCGIGLSKTAGRFQEDNPWVPRTMLACLFTAHIFFVSFYFTNYRESIGYTFGDGIIEAVQYACDKAGTGSDAKTIYINDASYPQVLFASRFPSEEYHKTVQYANWPDRFLTVSSFGNFVFGFDEIKDTGIYLLRTDSLYNYLSEDQDDDVYVRNHYAVVTR